MNISLSPRPKWPGRKAWQKITAQLKAARKHREEGGPGGKNTHQIMLPMAPSSHKAPPPNTTLDHELTHGFTHQ